MLEFVSHDVSYFGHERSLAWVVCFYLYKVVGPSHILTFSIFFSSHSSFLSIAKWIHHQATRWIKVTIWLIPLFYSQLKHPFRNTHRFVTRHTNIEYQWCFNYATLIAALMNRAKTCHNHQYLSVCLDAWQPCRYFGMQDIYSWVT